MRRGAVALHTGRHKPWFLTLFSIMLSLPVPFLAWPRPAIAQVYENEASTPARNAGEATSPSQPGATVDRDEHSTRPNVAGSSTTISSFVTLGAGSLTFDSKALRMLGKNGVFLEWGGYRLTASSAQIDLANRVVRLRGQVLWRAADTTFEAMEVSIDAGNGAGSLGQCHVFLADAGAHAWAAGAQWATGKDLQLFDTLFAPCWCERGTDPGSSGPPPAPEGPLVVLSARHAVFLEARPPNAIEPRPATKTAAASTISGEVPAAETQPPTSSARHPAWMPALPGRPERLRLESAVLKIKGVPVFYLPRLTLPLVPGIYSGPLAPRVAHGQDGLDVDLPWTWRIDRGHRLWLGLGWTEIRGIRAFGRLAYQNVSGSGSARVRYRADATPDTPSHRWEWDWEHAQRFDNGLGIYADMSALSDPDYLADFGTDIETRAGNVMASRARLEVPGERWTGTLGVRRYVDLDDHEFSLAGRTPELDVSYTGQARRIGLGVARVDADWGVFRQQSGTGAPVTPALEAGGPLYSSTRASIVWTVQPWHIATAKASVGYRGDLMAPLARATDGTDSQLASALYRHRVPLTIDLGTLIGRRFVLGGGAWESIRHLVEPGVQVAYDLWSSEDPAFVAAIGDVSRPARQIVFHVSQQVSGTLRDDGASREVEVGWLQVALGKEFARPGRWTDLEFRLTAVQPSRVGLSVLTAPDLRAFSWIFVDGSSRLGLLRLDYRLGWMNPSREANPPLGYYPTPTTGGTSLELGAQVGLDWLAAVLPGAGRFARGFSLEARSSVTFTHKIQPVAQRLDLRYTSPCGCFGIHAFIVLEEDRASPAIGGRLLSGVDPAGM